MINDAGKQPVNERGGPVRLNKGELVLGCMADLTFARTVVAPAHTEAPAKVNAADQRRLSAFQTEIKR